MNGRALAASLAITSARNASVVGIDVDRVRSGGSAPFRSHQLARAPAALDDAVNAYIDVSEVGRLGNGLRHRCWTRACDPAKRPQGLRSPRPGQTDCALSALDASVAAVLNLNGYH